MKKTSGKKKKKGQKLSDSDLLAMVHARKESSMGSDRDGDDLSTRRENNLKRYLGEAYGDERTGQSQVVTRECLEAVEWSLPSLMRIFSSSERVVEFRPVGADDEAGAKQETDYVNHVYSKENEGFSTTYNFVKSILMNPCAYVKSYWEEGEEVTTETYEGLFPQGIAELEEDSELEAVEAEETTVMVDTPEGSIEYPCYTVKFQRTRKTGRLLVEPVPPEELSISGQWNKVSLQGCDYISHSTTPTRSELIARGYDKDLVDSLPVSHGKRIEQDEAEQRHDDTVGSDGEYDTATDRSTEQIEVEEHYLYIDYDGDGSAEYRLVVTSGKHILDNEEIEDHPFTAGCAVPVPFSHVGLAWQELVEDLQKIYTTLTRQFLNNLYRTNNPRTVVGRGVNLADVINDLPNSPIRCKDINQLRTEPVHSVVGNIEPAFRMLDRNKEARTGVSRTSMGLDADALSRVGNGAFYASLEQANQRLELLARVIAEFSFKPLFLKIHKILLTHQTDRKEVKLSGEWVEVNPAEWKDRKDMDILVGLGTGNKQAQAMALDKIMEVQAMLKQAGSGMVSEQNIFKSLQQLVFLAGLPNPEAYFTDPAKAEQKPPQQKPEEGDALAAAQMEMAKVEREKANLQHKVDMFDLKQQMVDDQRKADATILKLQTEIASKAKEFQQKDRDLDRKEYEAETSAELGAAGILQEDERLEKSLTGVPDAG